MAFSDQVIPGCGRHPQEALVGVCAFCLRERLIHVVAEAQLHATDTDDDDDGAGRSDEAPCNGASMADQEEQQQQEDEEEEEVLQERHRSPINGTAMQRLMLNLASSQKAAEYNSIRSSNKSSDLLLVQQAENKSDAYSNQTVNFPGHNNHDRIRRSPLPPSCRRSNASEADMAKPPAAFYSLNNCTKQSNNKKSSWFPGLSKSKASSPLLQSPLPCKPSSATTRPAALLPPYLSSPLISGRKSASEALCSRQPHLMMQADLAAIAEINLGESAISLDNAEINLAAAAARAANSNNSSSSSSSSSWIASFFNRRRSRAKSSVLSHSGAINNGCSANQSPKVSFDAGRLSLDGAKPNLRQILKKADQTKNSYNSSSHELQGGRMNSFVQYHNGSINHQLYASNPSSNVALRHSKDSSSTTSVADDHDHQCRHPAALPLQKCRTVAQSRSKMRSVMLLQSKAHNRGGLRSSPDQAGLLNRDEQLDDELYKDAQGGEEEEEAPFPRSSSWGSKAWSKTLSPLYRGFNKKQQSNVNTGRKPNAIHEMNPSSTPFVISKPFSPLGLKAGPNLPSEHATNTR